MKDLETIKITDSQGNIVEIKVITILKKPNDEKQFLLYTFDSEAENIDIYASIIMEKNGEYILDAITEKEDWDLIQRAIEELSK